MRTFLEPRFKNVAFSSNETIESVKGNIKITLIQKLMDENKATITDKYSQKNTSTAIQDVPPKKISIWGSFDKAA